MNDYVTSTNTSLHLFHQQQNVVEELISRLLVDNETGTNSSNSSNSTKTIKTPTITNGEVLVNTIRLYGSLYSISIVLFIILRKYYPKLFSVRSWVPKIYNPIATEQLNTYNCISWCYTVFTISDNDIFNHCGMDTLCFLRALRFGRILCCIGCCNSLYLFPLYATANMSLFDKSNSTTTSNLNQRLQEISILEILSVANLPSSSQRFIATIIASYTFFLYAMYLIVQEYYWFIQWRHKFLSLSLCHNKVQNYTCYVAGIPEEYRSSYKLLQYFQDCAGSTHYYNTTNSNSNSNCNNAFNNDNRPLLTTQQQQQQQEQHDEHSAVYEAHIAMDAPKLDRLVSRRDFIVQQLEHSVFKQQRTGCQPIRRKVKLHLPSILPYVNNTTTNSTTPTSNHTADTTGNHDTNADTDINLNQNQYHNPTTTITTTFNNKDSRTSVISKPSTNNSSISSVVSSKRRMMINATSISSVQRVNAIHSFQEELHTLNRTIQESIHTITNPNDKYRSQLNKNIPTSTGSRHLHIVLSSDNEDDDDDDDDNVEIEGHSMDNNQFNTCQSYAMGQQHALVFENNVHICYEIVDDPLLGVFQQQQNTNTSLYTESNQLLSELQKDSETTPGNGSGNNKSNSSLWITLDHIVEETCDQIEASPLSLREKTQQPDSEITSSAEVMNNDTTQEPGPVEVTTSYTNEDNTDMKKEALITIKHDDIEENNASNIDMIPDSGDVEGGTKHTISDNRRFFKDKNKDKAMASIVSDSTNREPNAVQVGEMKNVSTSSKMSDSSNSESSRTSGSLLLSTSSGRLASMNRMAFDSAKHVTFKAAALATTSTTAITATSRAATQTIGGTIVKVSKDLHADKVLQTAGEQFINVTDQAKQVGSSLIVTAGAVAPILLTKTEGQPRTAGFVTFTNLYTTQTAIQMIHHPKPYVMDVIAAPAPDDIFWRNVGLPFRARRGGILTAFVSTAVLCFFWTGPTSFISSLTELSSLKAALPKLGIYLDNHQLMENVFAQIAPLVLLFFNEAVLPVILKYFATWEGHISASMLESSLFAKLGVFMIIQTFFVSAISGGVLSEIANIIDNPERIIDLLASSLPAQSNYFIQITLASTFFLQSIEILRIYPLFLALVRRFVGPRITPKERQQTWGYFNSLEDPPDFWHAETFAQLILFYMVTFVYQPIAPIVCFCLCFCFTIIESGYRYQLIHNYPVRFDTGGRLWQTWIKFTLASMIIAQLTLVGLLLLKKNTYAGPAIGPLIAVTVLFTIYINSKHAMISEYLPTSECVRMDRLYNANGPMDMSSVKNAYLQPSLQKKIIEPDYDEGIDYYNHPS